MGNKTANEALAYAKANFQTTLKMIDALQKISEQTGDQLIGAKHQDGKTITQYLFATAIISQAYTTLRKGKSKVQFAYNEYCGMDQALSDRLFKENTSIGQLALRLELIMDYVTSANLPDPYASDGIDISRVAREIAESADKVTDIIATIDKILES